MEPCQQSSDAVSRTGDDNLLTQPLYPSKSSSVVSSQFLEHPLLNSVLVGLIVNYLDPDFEQLKTLRLVSKVWTQATQHVWRNSCGVLTIVPDPPNFSKSNYQKGVSVSNFLEEFDDPQSPYQLSQKPFSKYKLKDFTLDLELCAVDGGQDTPAYRFWNTVGPLMNSVHLYKCLFVGPPADGSICPRVQFLARMIPNLNDLVLTDMTFEEARKYWRDEKYDLDFDEILDLTLVQEGSPLLNLRTLTIYGDLKKNMSLTQLLMLAPGLEVVNGKDQYLRTLLKPIHRVRYHSDFTLRPLSSLKNVDLMDTVGLYREDFPWNTLESPNPLEGVPVGSQVPLETLSILLAPLLGDTADELDVYLKSLSTTLKILIVFRGPFGVPQSKFLENASMAQLTELQLIGAIAPSFEFLMSTPNLKKLVIDLICFEKREDLKGIVDDYNSEEGVDKRKYEKYQDDMVMKVVGNVKDGISCTRLEHLEIDFEFPKESLRLLAKWMPNLKILKTILSVATVPVVCETWNELSELVCLYGSSIEDYCFIRDTEKAEFPGDPSEMKICDLKDLQRFQLDAYCDDCNLTDDVVYKGLLKMPGLKFVEICVNSQVSAEAEEALRKGIQFCKVVRDGHDDCGGSASSFLCDRCDFRNEVIYGIGRKDEDDDSVNSEDSAEEDSDDGSTIGLGLGPQSVDSDEDSRSSDGNSSAGTVEGDPVHYM